jgi:hypothetical protein
MNRTSVRVLFVSTAIFVVLLGIGLLAAARSERVMLFQHGTPELPEGHAFAIMNPFRNRRPEEVAEQLISDLRTGRCEQILREFHSEDFRICSIMSGNKSARLIWRKDESTTSVLVYHLPESNSNLWITARLDEMGFNTYGVSLIR